MPLSRSAYMVGTCCAVVLGTAGIGLLVSTSFMSDLWPWNLTPLVGLSFERDLILKIMDEINPNIPNNGDEKLKDEQRLWVVDWKFEEKPKAEPEQPGTTHKEGAKSFPKAKVMTATLEVCIWKRDTVQQGDNFIISTLLNYNPNNRQPLNPAKGCVIKNSKWELQQGASSAYWRVEQEATNLEWPQPKHYTGIKPDPDSPKNYWRYKVTLELPVGEEARKAAAPAAPAK